GILWRLIGVKTEVVKGTPANCVGVLILCKRFRVPGHGTRRLSNSPWRTAVSLIVECAVVRPAGFLRRCMKVDVTDVSPRSQRHAERLNSAVEVLVIQGVFVMPHSGTWVGHFVAHKPNPVVAGIGFDLADCRAGPGHDGWLHLDRRANT